MKINLCNKVLTKVAVIGLLTLGVNAGAQSDSVAKLVQIQGSVLVNQGRNYVSAQTGMGLRSGDNILALEDSSAVIVYGNDCEVRLEANSLLALEDENQCLRGIAPVAPPTVIAGSGTGGGAVSVASTAAQATGAAAPTTIGAAAGSTAAGAGTTAAAAGTGTAATGAAAGGGGGILGLGATAGAVALGGGAATVAAAASDGGSSSDTPPPPISPQ